MLRQRIHTHSKPPAAAAGHVLRRQRPVATCIGTLLNKSLTMLVYYPLTHANTCLTFSRNHARPYCFLISITVSCSRIRPNILIMFVHFCYSCWSTCIIHVRLLILIMFVHFVFACSSIYLNHVRPFIFHVSITVSCCRC